MEQNIIKSGEWGTCIWGIDETGFLAIGEGTAASIDENNPVPWEDVKQLITAVSVEDCVTFPSGTSLKGLFKDCENLVDVKLKGFDTTEVVDMNSMFENCSSIKDLDLSGFNTMKTEDMGRMFSGCRSLGTLDLSSFNTTRTRNMRNMFSRCTKLQALCLGERFSTEGNGGTSCGQLAIRETGKYRMAKVLNVKGGLVTYYENAGRRGKVERQTISDFTYTIEDVMFESPALEYRFFGWSENTDGSGNVYLPGDELESVNNDLDLYAVWICPPSIGEIEPMEEIAYGEPLPFAIPEIVSENDESIYGYLEISPSGETGTWRPIEYNAILPVSCNGYLLRLCATNKCGTSVSNVVQIKIKKAGKDLSKVRWAETADMTYDGTPKEVWLEGLPEGVTPVYSNNYAVDAGTYSASVELEYDRDNYSIPVRIKNHEWTIRKARFDMSEVCWDYTEPFEYDGTEKGVRLTGLPLGIEPTYTGSTATNAGIMTASASLDFDESNFEAPSQIMPLVWEINRKAIDVADLEWSSSEDFIYDGYPKNVTITNLPKDAEIEYTDIEAVQAGSYLARGTLVGNYFSALPIEHEWEIKKARYDMSQLVWTYTAPFVFDREPHEVSLLGVPSGVTVRYLNHIATDSGDYTAVANFQSTDTHNYLTPDDMTLRWSIKKAVADMSEVCWTYTEPFTYDGNNKTVDLVGLPTGVAAVIDNGVGVNAGLYNAHANLKYDERNYEVTQPADCRWQINKTKYDMSEVEWSYEEPFTYDGELKSVFLRNLPEGINVEYTDNVKLDSGKYVATAKLTPSDLINYEIPEINGCAWSIKKLVLDKGDIVWSDDSELVYDGNVKSVKIISEISDRIKVEYSGDTAVNAGEHEAVATFYPTDTHNYEAPEAIHHKWRIQKGNFELSNIVWDYNAAFTYDGKKKKVQLVDVPEGVVVHYENNTATTVGEYVAVAKFELQNADNYYPLEPVALRWSINKATYDMTEAVWQDERSFVYDGNKKSVVINNLPDGVVPVYTDNTAVNAGEYIAAVNFQYDEVNYEKPSFPECRWGIEKAVFDIGHANWDYEGNFVYDGSEKGVRIINLPEGANIEYDNISAVNAGIYYASAEVVPVDSDNYIGITLPGLTWRIEKGEYDMSKACWDYDLPLCYDGQEKRITLRGLPEGVTPNYNGNLGVEAGQYIANASFTITDNYNYNVPTIESCRWEISKRDVDMSGVTWDYNEPIVYDGKMHEVTLLGLPKNVKAIYTGNAETEVGNHTANAELVLYDGANYNAPSIDGCKWEIVKADYDMSDVYWDYDNPKTYNTREQGIYLENLPNGVVASYKNNTGTNVGRYEAQAELAVIDDQNYNAPVVGGCAWEIKPADVNMDECKWDFEPGSFVYDGKEKKVQLINVPKEVTVKYNGVTATGAGSYYAAAEFKVKSDNYNVPMHTVCSWFIEKADCDMSKVKWEYNDEFTYDGKPHGVELSGLPANVTATYENNSAIDAGTYLAVARFSTDEDNFNIPESMSCSWTINKANCDISEIRWDYDQAFTYDGCEKVMLLAGVPKKLRAVYRGNVATNAGQYTATAELVPVDDVNYNAPAPLETVWEISKADYDMSQTKWMKEKSFVYDGDKKVMELEGYPSSITPVYTGNSSVASGNYAAYASFEYDTVNYNEPTVEGCMWEIVKAKYDMSNVFWSYEEPFVYDETLKSVTLVNLPAGITPIYNNNTGVDSGDYYAEVLFKYDEANYERPSFEGCNWKIDKADAPIRYEDLEWTYKDVLTYNGEVQSIKLVSKNYSSVVTKENSLFGRFFSGSKKNETAAQTNFTGIPDEFEVMLEENEKTDVGIYYAKATLRHINPNYRELVVDGFRWEIKKAVIDMSNVRWDYDSSFTYDGEEKRVELIGVPSELTVKYVDNTAVKAGNYEAHAIFQLVDEKNYEKPRPIKGCLWTIDKASYDMSSAQWTYDDDLVYNGKEQVVKVVGLPEDVKAEVYNGNKATDAGTYTAEVRFKYKNPENYNMPEMEPLRWKIQKRRINTENISWNYNDSTIFVFDESYKEVKLIGLPKDVDVVYVANNAVGAGTYVAKAKLIYDTKNFVVDEIPDLVWKIEKATFDTRKVAWTYDKPFIYNGEMKKISLKNVPNKIDVRYMDNKATEIGSYTAKAYLTYNRDNYNAPDIDTTIEWEIVRND